MLNWQAPGDPLASLRLSLGGTALPTLPPSLGIWCLCTGLDPAALLTGDPGTTWYPQGWVCILLASFPFSLYSAFYDFMHLHLINQFACYLSQALKIKTAFEVLKIIVIFIIENMYFNCIIKYQFSCSVVSDSLRPHELQHARSPCPSQTPGIHSDSSPSSQ